MPSSVQRKTTHDLPWEHQKMRQRESSCMVILETYILRRCVIDWLNIKRSISFYSSNAYKTQGKYPNYIKLDEFDKFQGFLLMFVLHFPSSLHTWMQSSQRCLVSTDVAGQIQKCTEKIQHFVRVFFCTHPSVIWLA